MPQRPVPIAPPRQCPKAPVEPRRWSSADLLCGRRVACIEHRGEVYTLSVTSLGKLILTK